MKPLGVSETTGKPIELVGQAGSLPTIVNRPACDATYGPESRLKIGGIEQVNLANREVICSAPVRVQAA